MRGFFNGISAKLALQAGLAGTPTTVTPGSHGLSDAVRQPLPGIIFDHERIIGSSVDYCGPSTRIDTLAQVDAP